MTQRLICRMKPYIQPFERTLALAELHSLADSEPTAIPGQSGEPVVFSLPPNTDLASLTGNLAYWETIETEQIYPSTQVLRERTFNIGRNGVPINEIEKALTATDIGLPNRRCLRYATHGIHEYRGKFFPQLVRSLINIAGVPKGGIVADPMCGSGTTAVEAVLGGFQTVGLDMNPLSVQIARVKCSLLQAETGLLISQYEAIRSELRSLKSKRDMPYFESLPSRDQEYLTCWFSESVLRHLDKVADAIQRSDERIQDFFWLCLSNILRRISWQKDDDLRVRKEMRTGAEIDPVQEFLDETCRSLRVVLAFLFQNDKSSLGSFDIKEGDARDLATEWNQYKWTIDAIITSPPYATALPYLDTDRLSLSYLRLLSRSDHRQRDQYMIGNREIGERDRARYWSLFQSSKERLPRSISLLIQKVSSLNSQVSVGFRRRNLPALLTKYFIDMQKVFEGISVALKPGGPFYVVIGNNHTIAGGERVEIETASLLIDLASDIGLILENRIPMEMLVSRDIFKRNAVASEEILCFRNPVKNSHIF